jgi:hypothetical protein
VRDIFHKLIFSGPETETKRRGGGRGRRRGD